jgi:hypothetical protein
LYTENLGKDVSLFVKAFLSNQVARFAPKLYVNLTHQTGRGTGEEKALEVANYFIQCFADYRAQMGLNEQEIKEYLTGKVVLEYGPGDTLGVALLMYAHGAEAVCCVDRFSLSHMSTKNIDVYLHLLNLLGKNERERAQSAFQEKGNPRSGFNPNAITYKVTKNGLSGSNREYDLIISRAVLEHVNNLEETMLDIKRSMKDGGISLHEVDLRSHGLDRYTDFDFLTWPEMIYRLMYSHKGFPNRWRADKYKESAERANLRVKELSPTDRLDPEKINIVYPKLARKFSHLSIEELSWKGFWLVLEHA